MEDASYLDLAKFVLPKVPSILRAAAAHSLSLSPTSSKWDLQTTMQVTVLRSIMNAPSPSPLGKSQAMSTKFSEPKGKLWTAPVNIAPPIDTGTRDAIFNAIAEMGSGTETYTNPEGAVLEAEWTGFRSEAKSANEPLPTGLTPKMRYDKLMAEPNRTSKTTILYFHGGAYYLCGFSTHRVPISRLSKACNGRALAVAYRLAPQAAFPSQLIDALHSYLYLLYPPQDALHEPVPANEIVFGGDSAGGNLAFALLQFILQLRRSNRDSSRNPTVRYNGHDVEVPLPAGVSGLSPWLDIARSSPSLVSNAQYDYLPPPTFESTTSIPHDNIWPTKPPRGDVFCDLSLLDHPLVSPLVAKDWSGSPPIWVMAGDELLYDEIAVVAVRAKEQGVTVQWEHYEAMPHVFSMLIPHIKNSTTNFNNWGAFAKACVEGKVQPKSIRVMAKSGIEEEVELAIGKEASLGWEEAVRNVKQTKERKLTGYDKKGAAMLKPSL